MRWGWGWLCRAVRNRIPGPAAWCPFAQDQRCWASQGPPEPTCRRLPPSTLATLLLKNESKQTRPSPPLPEHLCLGRAHLDCCGLFQPKGNRACQNLEQGKLNQAGKGRGTHSPLASSEGSNPISMPQRRKQRVREAQSKKEAELGFDPAPLQGRQCSIRKQTLPLPFLSCKTKIQTYWGEG